MLGGGAAGLVASVSAAAVGARVALVEESEQPGGDCLFTGCVPSKSMIASAKLAHGMRTAGELGLEPHEPEIDFARVMERVQRVIGEAARRDTPESLREKGVEVVRARGRFAGPGLVRAGERELAYRTAIVATGSVPALPPIPGLERSGALTSETVWDLRERPHRLAVLGGGPVGVELAQAFARLGSRVEIVESSDRLLPVEEPEAGRLVEEVLSSEGVAVHTGARVESVEPSPVGAGRLVAGELSVDYDRLLVAVGRSHRTEDLGLETVGVQVGGDGALKVDDRLRTTGDRIWAAGDVVGRLYFTHVAGMHGLIAMANALFRVRRGIEGETVPWVTFTDPEVARVGLCEKQARQRLGYEPTVLHHDLAESDRALTAGETNGFAKLVSDRRGRLLGATVVAPAAGESIAELTRAVNTQGKVSSISQTVHAYPTFSEAPARAADGWWHRRYLNPRGRRLLRPLLAVLRVVDHPR
ncbi:MAG: FAD-dependent oxidoreductase [Actinomycetota bacterium]|nr:FAD-dependent oxidoreductase [Actinomycetota bacterium]